MTTAIVITARGVTGSFSALGAQLKQVAVKGLQRAAYDFDAQVVREIDATLPHAPVNLGQLKRDRRVTILPNGATHEMLSPQAKWMEFGTRPHWAPYTALLQWAVQKTRGSKRDAGKLARAAQIAIAKRGTKPRRFYARALEKAPGIVRKRLEEALARVGSVAA